MADQVDRSLSARLGGVILGSTGGHQSSGVAVVEGGQTYQLHWDHIMRPVMATESTGSVVWAAHDLTNSGSRQTAIGASWLGKTRRWRNYSAKEAD